MWYGALLAAAALWGAAFVPQRSAMEHTGPHTFNVLRFAGGFVLVAAIAGFRECFAFARDHRGPVVLLGVLLFLGSYFQQAGMVTATAGQGGFITGLYLVFVPMLLGIVWHERVGWNCWSGALLALAGLALLTLDETLAVSPGDAWLLACAIAFALHIIAIGKVAPRLAPLPLAAGQFAVCAILSSAGSAASEQAAWGGAWHAYPELLYIIIASTGLGFTLQIAAQRRIPAANAGVVMSLESVFAVLAGYALLGEALTARQLLGCLLMFAGMLLAQIHELRGTIAKSPNRIDLSP